MSGSRGKPKPKLRDLSQQPLTNAEQDALLEALTAKTPPSADAVEGRNAFLEKRAARFSGR
jgi:hypothetical protein